MRLMGTDAWRFELTRHLGLSLPPATKPTSKRRNGNVRKTLKAIWGVPIDVPRT